MIHTVFFYIRVNFVFKLPHYFTSYIYNSSKKDSKQEILKKEEDFKRNSNPEPQNHGTLKAIACVHWATSVNLDYSSLKVVYIPALS